MSAPNKALHKHRHRPQCQLGATTASIILKLTCSACFQACCSTVRVAPLTPCHTPHVVTPQTRQRDMDGAVPTCIPAWQTEPLAGKVYDKGRGLMMRVESCPGTMHRIMQRREGCNGRACAAQGSTSLQCQQSKGIGSHWHSTTASALHAATHHPPLQYWQEPDSYTPTEPTQPIVKAAALRNRDPKSQTLKCVRYVSTEKPQLTNPQGKTPLHRARHNCLCTCNQLRGDCIGHFESAMPTLPACLLACLTTTPRQEHGLANAKSPAPAVIQ